MNITLLIIGLVLSSIATLITLVFSIISLATGKNKNAIKWGVGFIISIIILIISLVQVMKLVAQKVKTGIEWLDEHKNSGGLLEDTVSDDWAIQERQYFLDTLQKYTNENVKSIVPSDFYANKTIVKTNDSNLILPFVYPFSIRLNNNYLGEIINDVNDSVFLSNISQMAFDENFMIAKVDNTNDQKLLNDGRAGIEYILFDLRTREYLEFTSEKILKEKADKIGYTGPLDMKYLSNIYQGWLQD